MKIAGFMLLCFLVVSVSGGGGKKKKVATGHGIKIHGTVHIKLPSNHPKPEKVMVLVKSKVHSTPIEEESKPCTEHKEEEDNKDPHKIYVCPYEMKKDLGDHEGTIQIGAKLESKHITDKLKIHGKDQADAWSHELAVPPKHLIHFMFDIEKDDKKHHVILIGVHIHGEVHLKVEGHHEPPKQIIVLIKTGENKAKQAQKDNPEKLRHTKSKSCSENKCHYDTMFYVVQEDEVFHVGAKVKQDQKPAWSQPIHSVPKSLVIERDFNLHIPAKGELRVDLEGTKKKKAGEHQDESDKKKADDKKKGSAGED